MGKSAIAPAEIDYPDSDGKPMAETDIHRELMVDAIHRLRARYSKRKDVYVSGNLLVYYVEGDPRMCLAPDCFVAFGVPSGDRRTFKVWNEGTFPAVVFEFTSRKTKKEDTVKKFHIYRDAWKVKELFMFDPTEDYLKPSLIGYRLEEGELKPIQQVGDRIASIELGITLERDGTHLLLRDAKSRKELLLPAEMEARRANRKALELQARNDQLLAELEALRKKSS